MHHNIMIRARSQVRERGGRRNSGSGAGRLGRSGAGNDHLTENRQETILDTTNQLLIMEKTPDHTGGDLANVCPSTSKTISYFIANNMRTRGTLR